MKSYMNSYYGFSHEFSAMKNVVSSWLNPYKWIHKWIIVEFINLNWPASNLFHWGNKNYSSKVITTPSLQAAHRGNASPKTAARLLLMATGRRVCDCRRWVLLRTAEWGGLEGLDGRRWASLRSDLPCLSAMKETLETFKLRGINVTIQAQQLDLQEAFKQKKADDSTSDARHNSKCRTNNDVGIHLGTFSWRILPPCC